MRLIEGHSHSGEVTDLNALMQLSHHHYAYICTDTDAHTYTCTHTHSLKVMRAHMYKTKQIAIEYTRVIIQLSLSSLR